jgi:hypothetical protein
MLAIQIRAFCAAGRPSEGGPAKAGERAVGNSAGLIGHVIQVKLRWWSRAAAA